MGVDGLYKTGGIAFVISGVLFLLRYLLEFTAGTPPSNGTAILTWVADAKLSFEFANESLCFAAISLIPVVIALYYYLADTERTKAAVGCGILAALIPILLVLCAFQGRLFYPVYGIVVNTPAVAEFVVTLYYGGLHMALLMFGVATIVLSWAMVRGGFGRAIAYLGIVAGVIDIIAAYPDTIGPILGLVFQIIFTAWFIAMGMKLYDLGRLARATG